MNTLRRRVMVSGDEGIDYSKQYLTIVSEEDNNVIYWLFVKGYGNTTSYKKINVSTDNGLTWTEKTSQQNPGTLLATLNKGDKLMIYGTNSSYGAYSARNIYYNGFSSTKNFKVEGNIMSLIKQDFEDVNVLPSSSNCFYSLFSSQKVTDISNLTLPATTLRDSCYRGMFSNCSMIESTPILPAEVLVSECYKYMFHGCSNLKTIKCFAKTLSAYECLSTWVDGVSATGTFYKKAGVTWPSGNSGIPSGWTVVEV